MVASVRFARVPGMLVLLADRLDEADRTKRALLLRSVRELNELLLVLQVRTTGRARRVVRVVVERLMVELEEEIRTIREFGARNDVRVRTVRPRAVRPARCVDVSVCVRPAAGVPRPADPLGGQTIADRRIRPRDELGSK